MVSIFGAFLKKEEGAILVYKDRGGEFYGSEDFCPVGEFPALCWHIPLTPRAILYLASERVVAGIMKLWNM